MGISFNTIPLGLRKQNESASSGLTHSVDVHQVRLCPERTETHSLQSCPPAGEVLKVLVAVARVDLELEPTDGKHVVLGVCGEEGRECVKLPTFDVDLENSMSVNVCPERRPIRGKNAGRGENQVRTVETHERVERPVLGVVVVVVMLRPAVCEGFEMSSIPQFEIVVDLRRSQVPTSHTG